MLFFCGFQKNHILFWAGNKEAVTLSEAHEKLAVFESFGCFIKTFDFDSLAVSVNDSLWIHEDGNHAVSFDVGKLRHQAAFNNVISINAAWHSVTWLSPDWVVVIVLNVGDVIEESFVQESFAVFSFFWLNHQFSLAEVEVCKMSFICSLNAAHFGICHIHCTCEWVIISDKTLTVKLLAVGFSEVF